MRAEKKMIYKNDPNKLKLAVNKYRIKMFCIYAFAIIFNFVLFYFFLPSSFSLFSLSVIIMYHNLTHTSRKKSCEAWPAAKSIRNPQRIPDREAEDAGKNRIIDAHRINLTHR